MRYMTIADERVERIAALVREQRSDVELYEVADTIDERIRDECANTDEQQRWLDSASDADVAAFVVEQLSDDEIVTRLLSEREQLDDREARYRAACSIFGSLMADQMFRR